MIFSRGRSTRYPLRFVEGVDFVTIGGFLGFAETYRLRCAWQLQTVFRPHEDLVGDFDLCGIRSSGIMWALPGYAWDGASFPAWDTPSVVRASLAHDIPYQLLREKDLGALDRAPADELLRKIMIEDGAWRIRANYFCWTVKRFAASAAKPRR